MYRFDFQDENDSHFHYQIDQEYFESRNELRFLFFSLHATARRVAS